MKLYEISTQGATELQARLQQAKEGLDLSYFVNKRPPLTVDASGIARVSVFGPLIQDAAPVERDLGATDYADLAAEVATEGVRGVLLRCDSPGGTVAGCIEVAKLIENLSVPVVAYVHGSACSAAYKLACGADWIVSSPSATVGNIGTILVWADTSAFMASMGVELNAIVSEGATLKSTGHLASLTDEQREFLQSGIDQAGADFRAHVESNRNVDPEVWRAGWYAGEKARSLGLVDELGSEADALARLNELIALTEEALA
jgi:signal peptide peptidase SppA